MIMMIMIKLKNGVLINPNCIESIREDSGKRWRISMLSGKEYIVDVQEVEMILSKVKLDGFQ